MASSCRVSFPFLRAKISRDLGSAFMFCPLGWSASPKNVFLVQLCAAFHQQANKLCISKPRCVVQWSAVRVSANWEIPVRIFARVQQQTGTFNASILSRQGEREVPVAGVGSWQHSANILKTAKRNRDGKRDAPAAQNQRAQRLKPAVKNRRFHSGVRICPVIA